MKVWITLDYIDGTQSRFLKKPVYIDEINLHGLLLNLSTVGVAGVTFTRADVLGQLTSLSAEKVEPSKPRTRQRSLNKV